jgi:hypothetical protein
MDMAKATRTENTAVGAQLRKTGISHEARLAAALRDNLRRRKASETGLRVDTDLPACPEHES